ncbi:hypothetical protein HPULCUR_003906 [Helicostylum pulchrum]|uniref:Cytochrome P450 n=1 Tax=Helicostylum pulchrum TaxID=562976 RepID=A0ABP9XWS3_9FUNG
MDQFNKLIKPISLPNFASKDVFPIVSITAAASIFYSTYQIFLSQKKVASKKIPIPGSSYPYVGHMLSLGKLPGKTVAKWHEELGPIIKLRMGVQNWIMVNDPILAHKIFVVKGAETSHRPQNTYAHNSGGLGEKGVAFAQPDSRWKENRAAALSVLAPKHIEKYIPYIHKEAKDLVTRFIKSTEKEGSVDPFKLLELNSMNVITETSFSKRFDSVEDPEFIKLSSIVETTMIYCGAEHDLANFLPIVSIYDYFFGNRAEKKNFNLNERNPYLRRIVKEAAYAEGPNVIKAFEEGGFKLTEDELMALALLLNEADLIVAGTDTTSITLAWNIAIMCHYPDIQRKVSAEIDKFIESNGRIPNFKEREQLPYCISVMKESMRYKPTTTFGLPHTAHEDLYVDGYIIPKGASIISSMESMHMNPDIYTEPKKFNPERFLNNIKTMQSAANGKIEERDHFNFGWGRRICPAISLAETEIFAAFVQIFSRCSVEPADDGLPDIESAVNSGLTTAPVRYKVKFIKRTNSLT